MITEAHAARTKCGLGSNAAPFWCEGWSWRGTNRTHKIAGNVPPCRAGRWSAEHGPGKKPFCEIVLNFRYIFGNESVNGNGARDDENATCRAGGYDVPVLVSRDVMTYSARDHLRDSHAAVKPRPKSFV